MPGAKKFQPPLSDYLTTAQVAEKLGYTPMRVRQLKAELGGVLVGDRLLFPAAAVAGFERPARGWPKGKPNPRKAANRKPKKGE